MLFCIWPDAVCRLYGLHAALFATLVVAGCSHEVIHHPPAILGERKNAQGDVIQRIIREETTFVTIKTLTPEDHTGQDIQTANTSLRNTIDRRAKFPG